MTKAKEQEKEKRKKVGEFELPNPEWPPEEKLRYIQRYYMMMIVDLALAFSERLGEEAWEIMRRTMYRLGRQKGVAMKKRFPQINPDNLKSVHKAYGLTTVALGDDPQAIEVIESSRKRRVIRVHKCTIVEQLSRCPGLCMGMLDYIDQGTFDELGVKITQYEVPLRMSKSDQYCEVIFEIQ